MSVDQKPGILLESKAVQKLSLEKNIFSKKWSHNTVEHGHKISKSLINLLLKPSVVLAF